MSKKIGGIYLFMLLLALSLGACGGGATNDDIRRQQAECASGVAASCQLLGQPVPSVPPVISILPASITTSDCTTNIPFIFSGGTAPFTVITSDNILVPVSSAQELGSKHYFLASLGSYSTKGVPWSEKVTVLDSQSRSAAADITVASAHTCALNPLLQTEPASANAHQTEILAFRITGGAGAGHYSVKSSDTSIVTVPGGVLPGSTFNAQAMPSVPNRTTEETVLLTVMSDDGQNANIRFTVLPLQ